METTTAIDRYVVGRESNVLLVDLGGDPERAAGVGDVQTKVHVRTVHVGESRRTLHLTLLELMHDNLLALEWFNERQFIEHKRALLQHLSDPDTLLIDRLLVQA